MPDVNNHIIIFCRFASLFCLTFGVDGDGSVARGSAIVEAANECSQVKSEMSTPNQEAGLLLLQARPEMSTPSKKVCSLKEALVGVCGANYSQSCACKSGAFARARLLTKQAADYRTSCVVGKNSSAPAGGLVQGESCRRIQGSVTLMGVISAITGKKIGNASVLLSTKQTAKIRQSVEDIFRIIEPLLKLVSEDAISRLLECIGIDGGLVQLVLILFAIIERGFDGIVDEVNKLFGGFFQMLKDAVEDIQRNLNDGRISALFDELLKDLIKKLPPGQAELATYFEKVYINIMKLTELIKSLQPLKCIADIIFSASLRSEVFGFLSTELVKGTQKISDLIQVVLDVITEPIQSVLKNLGLDFNLEDWTKISGARFCERLEKSGEGRQSLADGDIQPFMIGTMVGAFISVIGNKISDEVMKIVNKEKGNVEVLLNELVDEVAQLTSQLISLIPICDAFMEPIQDFLNMAVKFIKTSIIQPSMELLVTGFQFILKESESMTTDILTHIVNVLFGKKSSTEESEELSKKGADDAFWGIIISLLMGIPEVKAANQSLHHMFRVCQDHFQREKKKQLEEITEVVFADTETHKFDLETIKKKVEGFINNLLNSVKHVVFDPIVHELEKFSNGVIEHVIGFLDPIMDEIVKHAKNAFTLIQNMLKFQAILDFWKLGELFSRIEVLWRCVAEAPGWDGMPNKLSEVIDIFTGLFNQDKSQGSFSRIEGIFKSVIDKVMDWFGKVVTEFWNKKIEKLSDWVLAITNKKEYIVANELVDYIWKTICSFPIFAMPKVACFFDTEIKSFWLKHKPEIVKWLSDCMKDVMSLLKAAKDFTIDFLLKKISPDFVMFMTKVHQILKDHSKPLCLELGEENVTLKEVGLVALDSIMTAAQDALENVIVSLTNNFGWCTNGVKTQAESFLYMIVGSIPYAAIGTAISAALLPVIAWLANMLSVESIRGICISFLDICMKWIGKTIKSIWNTFMDAFYDLVNGLGDFLKDILKDVEGMEKLASVMTLAEPMLLTLLKYLLDEVIDLC